MSGSTGGHSPDGTRVNFRLSLRPFLCSTELIEGCCPQACSMPWGYVESRADRSLPSSQKHTLQGLKDQPERKEAVAAQPPCPAPMPGAASSPHPGTRVHSAPKDEPL